MVKEAETLMIMTHHNIFVEQELLGTGADPGCCKGGVTIIIMKKLFY